MRYLGIVDERTKYVNENIIEIKRLLKELKNVNDIDIDEFLKFCMNFSDMQMWLFEKKIKGNYFNQTDIYEKLFSLRTNEEIVAKYDEYMSLPEKEDKIIKKRYIDRQKGWRL
jgi:hypothetical protein